MRLPLIALALAGLTLAACNPGPEEGEEMVAAPAADAPVYSATGTLASVDGRIVNIEHPAVPEAGLAAGVTGFTSYADVVATAPDEPGAAVDFSFQEAGDGYSLTELKAAS